MIRNSLPGGRLAAALFLPGFLLLAQDADVVRVPLTDPSRPVNLKVDLLEGAIAVRGVEGKEVVVRSEGKSEGDRRDRVPERAKGLRRVGIGRAGFQIEEQDNRVTVSGHANNDVNLTIEVPRRANLVLRLTNGGGVTVENVEGDVDANVTNGSLTMKGISGSAIAHALNDDVIVVMDRIAAGKPMSFTSLNGDIDVTLPANTQARLKMKTDNGEIYSDFDLKLEAGSTPEVEQRGKSGRYRVKIDRAVTGTINGGGPDFQFTSLNGEIFIRKR